MTPNLASFLDLGFFLDYNNDEFKIDLSGIDKSKYAGASFDELVAFAGNIWQQTIAEKFKYDTKHVVPISGGLDSRAVLAGLLEFTSASNISTFTYGVPGSWDFEIGKKVAKKIGLKHISFDLGNHQYNQEELLDISKRIDHQTVLFHHWPVWEMDRIFEGYTFWMGYLGVVTGASLTNTGSNNIGQALITFKNKNRYTKSIKLSNSLPSYDHLIDTTLVNPDLASIDEQLNYNNRQAKFIAPHLLMKGYNFISPIASQPFLNFILSVNDDHRRFQKLYKAFLLKKYPKEFSYVTKTTGGLPITVPKPFALAAKGINKLRQKLTGFSKSVNYLPFNTRIREKNDLQKIITDNIQDLNRRNIIDNIDPLKILNNHLKGYGEHYDILIILTSLEIHLKAGKTL